MIKDRVREGLITKYPRTPRFYTKPKTHNEGISGILAISLFNYHSSKILEYADYFLQPKVREILSYIKDTSDFLCKLKPVIELSENSLCKITLYKHSEFRRDKSSKNISWTLRIRQ